jgi:hypothetical protein
MARKKLNRPISEATIEDAKEYDALTDKWIFCEEWLWDGSPDIRDLPDSMSAREPAIMRLEARFERLLFAKFTPRTTWKGFIISSVFKGEKPAPWSALEGRRNWNHNRVTIKRNGHQITFDYWGSIASPEIKTADDLRNALYCYITDAISGGSTFLDFCSDFGYSHDSIKVHKIWRTHVKMRKRIAKLITDDELYDTMYALAEVC